MSTGGASKQPGKSIKKNQSLPLECWKNTVVKPLLTWVTKEWVITHSYARGELFPLPHPKLQLEKGLLDICLNCASLKSACLPKNFKLLNRRSITCCIAEPVKYSSAELSVHTYFYIKLPSNNEVGNQKKKYCIQRHKVKSPSLIQGEILNSNPSPRKCKP